MDVWQAAVRTIGLCAISVAAGCAAQRTAFGDGGPSAAPAPLRAVSAGIPADHRPSAEACDSPRPSEVPDGGFSPGSGSCSVDADCADGGWSGRCVLSTATDAPFCTYDECREDSDCGDAGVCVCRSGQGYDTNVCVPGDCRVDADCGDGGYCSPVVLGCAGLTGIAGYYCHTPQDECVNDSDCTDTAVQDLHCVFQVGKNPRWVCGPVDCSG